MPIVSTEFFFLAPMNVGQWKCTSANMLGEMSMPVTLPVLPIRSANRIDTMLVPVAISNATTSRLRQIHQSLRKCSMESISIHSRTHELLTSSQCGPYSCQSVVCGEEAA
jgi:hypothetical protein